jgi:hypothetical protein
LAEVRADQLGWPFTFCGATAKLIKCDEGIPLADIFLQNAKSGACPRLA